MYFPLENLEMQWIKYFLTDPEGMRCIVISLGHACSVWSGPCGKHSFGKHLGQVQPTLRTPTIIKILNKNHYKDRKCCPVSKFSWWGNNFNLNSSFAIVTRSFPHFQNDACLPAFFFILNPLVHYSWFWTRSCNIYSFEHPLGKHLSQMHCAVRTTSKHSQNENV